MGYVHTAAACYFVEGIFDVARAFALRGYMIIVVTNQAGIGRGYYSEEEFAHFMIWMQEVFVREGAAITAVYYCPDHPTA